MGIETATAIIIAAIVAGGSAEESRKTQSKAASKQRKQTAASTARNRDNLVVTPKGIAKKNARTALVVGSSRGVLSTEDQIATSGRGTLLGN